MKYKSKIFFVFYLMLGFGVLMAQTPVVGFPAGVTNTVVPADGRAIGWPGGGTFTYHNASWPTSSTCYYFGFPTTISALINGYSLAVCPSGMQNVGYSSSPSTGVIIYTGTTTYGYYDGTWAFVTPALNVRVTITFTTNPGNAAIPIIVIGGYHLIRPTTDFNVNVFIEVLSPASAQYIAGSASTWTPAITLFDDLHTNPSSLICTDLTLTNDFYTSTVTASASSATPYCVGNPISLSSAVSGVATLTYSWTGPNSYSTSGSANPFVTGSATTAMAGSYTETVTDGLGCPITSSTSVVVNTAPTITNTAGNPTANTGAGTCTAAVSYSAPTVIGTPVPVVTYVFTGATTGSGAGTGTGSTFNLGVTTVTLTATNSCGAPTCTFTVTVTDNIVPTISCPGNYSVNVAAGTCAQTVATGNPTIADNCGVTSLTWAMTGATTATGINNVGSYSFNKGITTVTYTDYDAAGNHTSCSYTVTVTDNIAPTISCPGNYSGYFTAAGTCSQSVVTANPTIADNCGVTSLTWAMTGATTATGINNIGTHTFNKGVTTVTYTDYDAAGNNTSCSYTVTVTDNIPPTITAPITVNTGTNTACTATGVALGSPTTGDNCSVFSVTNDHPSTTYPLGTTTVTWTVTDGSGNTATATQNVVVTDNVNPTFTSCPVGGYAANVAPGTCAQSVITANPTTADNCGVTKLIWEMTGATTGISANTGINYVGTHSFNVGITYVTYTVYDDVPNSATCVFTVTVTDNIFPTITAPANVNTTTNTGCTATGVSLGVPITADNCSVASVTNDAPGAFPLGTTTVKWTVTDGSGNATSTTTQTVTVTDNGNPTISCPGNISVNVAAGTCGQSIVTTNPTIADNCAVTKLTWIMTGANVGSSPATGINNVGTYTSNLGITTITYTDYDAAGNSATCFSTVTVTDNIAPTITCPVNVSVNVASGLCTQSVLTANPTTADNCAVTKLTWAMTGATVASSAATGINNAGTQTFNLGITTVTYTVYDAAGNSAVCSSTVTITDNIPPTFSSCPGNYSVNVAAGVCTQSVITTDPTTADNCAVTKLTWVMTGTTVAASLGTGINNVGTYTFNLGLTTVTYTDYDAAGNSATCSYTVTVADNINPTITCPSNISANVAAGTCTQSVLTPNPTTADNCSVTKLTWAMTGATTANSAATGINNVGTYTFNLGITTVTYTDYDAAGNSATCSFTVTVLDNINPTVTCQSNVTVNVATGICTESVITTNPTTADNCAVTKLTWAMTGATIANSVATGMNNVGTYTFNAGITTVAYTDYDAAGNTGTCSYTVTVSDNIPPTFTSCPGNIATTVTAGTCGKLVTTTDPTTADNCAVAKLTWAMTGATVANSAATGINNVGTYTFNAGITTVTYTVYDAALNTATCTYTVTVTDNVNPSFTYCPANYSVFTAAGTCAQTVATANPITTDNCGVTKLTWAMTGATIAASLASGINNIGTYTFNSGTTVVIYTDYDAAGNSGTCLFTVTVADNINPLIFCPSDVSVNVAPGTCAQSVATANPTTADNCAVTKLTWAMTGATIASSPAGGINNVGTYVFNAGTTTVTYTDYDAAGNNSSCSSLVIVNDNINPTFTYCPGNVVTTVTAGTCSKSVITANPTTADNCSVAKLTWAMTGATTATSLATGINNVGTYTFNTGITTVTYTVYDAAGNIATCSYTVTITDNINPTITCQSNIATTVAAGVCTQSVTTTDPTTADNCSVTKLTWALTGATTGTSAATGINNLGTYTFNLGITTVTYTVYDAAGNLATCSYTVTVTDNINPTFTSCPSNISVNVAAGTCTQSVITPNPVTADNCSVTKLTWAITGATIANSVATGINNVGTQIFNLGITTVTYTDYDAAGNSATCSYTVTVTDNINPTITCPSNISTTVAAGMCTQSVLTPNPTTADNCAVTKLTWAMTGATIDASAATGINNVGTYTFNLGITTVTYTVYDAAGNLTTCSFTVTITDNINPTITCPSNISTSVAAGTCTQSVITPNPTTADNCTVTKLTWAMTGATTATSAAIGINNVGTQTFNLGITTVTYTAYDAAGNFATCSYTVTILDNINPTFTSCPINISTTVAAGTCTQSVLTVDPITADNCAVTKLTWAMTGATVASSAATGINNVGTQTFNLGITTVTYTAYDAAGNTATCSYTVTITDNINPTITCQSNVSTNPSAGTCTKSVVTTDPTTADNCSVTKLTWAMTGATIDASASTGINNVGTYTFNAGITTVTYTVYDAAGNSATCSYTVTVTDNINPTITCQSNVSVNVAAGICTQTVITTDPTTADNCAVAKLTWAMTGATIDASAATGINNVGTYTFNLGITTVTYTVYDAAGNLATCAYTVTVTDNINPTITCPGNVSVNVAAGICTQSVITPNSTTADNCAVTKLIWAMTGATIDASLATGINNVGTYTFNLGITTVTYTDYDAAGNSATCSYTVTVIDNINPTFSSCPANVAVNVAVGTCAQSVITTDPITADNCAVTKLTWVMTGATTGTSAATGINNVGTYVFNTGITTVTYTDYDAAGNSATCSYTVTVTDNIAPTITCQSNVSTTVAAGICTQTIITTDPTTADNCAVTKLTWVMTGATIDASAATGINNVGTYIFNLGITTVTYTVFDAAGNLATCSYTVTVTDNINPTITCPANIAVNVAAGICTQSVITPNPTTADNCSVTKLTWAMIGATVDASLATGINNVGTYTFNLGITTVTYTVYDAAGNSAACSFTVTVTDNINPTFTSCPANVSVNVAIGICTQSVITVDPTTADNCAVTKLTWVMTGATIDASVSSGINNIGTYIFNSGITTVTYTVYDAAGNSATCSYTVTVNDNIAPTITCQSNISTTVAAGTCTQSVITTNPTTADNCAVTKLTWAMTGATIDASAATGINNVGTYTFNLGITTVTYIVYDAFGNSATCSYTVTITDNINPTITCPGNIATTVAAGICTQSVITTNPTTADNCSVTKLTWAMTGVTIDASAAIGINNVGTYTFNLGITTVTYIVYDAAGNSDTCSYTVTITDNINPTITCPGNIATTVAAGICTQSVITTDPTTADNCSVTKLTWVMTGATIDASASTGINNVGTYTFNLGVTTITYTVFDAAGNSANCSYTVTVADNIAPTISCQSNVSTTVIAGTCAQLVVTTDPATADNCSVTKLTWAMTGATVATSAPTGINNVGTYSFNSGITTVTYTVYDATGNSATCSYTITVADNINPTITCSSNVSVNVAPGICTQTVITINPTTADNCSVTKLTWAMTGVTIDASAATGINNVGTYTFNLGLTTVTYTAYDLAGNSATCSSTVTVIDNINPTIVCPGDTTVNNALNQCSAIVSFTAPIGKDNCSGATTALTAGLPSGSVFPLGTTIETFTVTDGSGNTASCSFNVTVKDTQFPIITCPGHISVSNDAGQCGAIVNYTAPIGTDNCTGATTAQTAGLASGSLFPIGTTTQIFTVTDSSHNSSSCSFTVTVADTTVPVIICPGDTTTNNNPGQCGAIVNFNTPLVTDNCNFTLVQTVGLASGSLFPIGATTQTFVATDSSGNSSTCSFIITIKDNESPVVNCTNDTATCDNGSNIINYITPTSTDNCPGLTVAQTTGLPSGSAFPIGITINTFEFTDASGNKTLCVFKVTVHPLPIITFNNVPPVCEADLTFMLSVAIPTGGTYNGLGITNNTFNPAGTGTGTFPITYTFTDTNGCSSTSATTITVNPNPTVTLSNLGTFSNRITPFALSGGVPVGGTYSGAGVTSNIFDPKTAGLGIHQITYTYTNSSGCSDSAIAPIEVIDGSAIIIYNALTPNGDGIDDTWIIKNIDKFPGNKVQIFNRWGTKVFEATNYNNEWNGGNLPQSSYFYLLDLNNGDKTLKGTVTIIR